jgi:hypothetical protein
LYKLNDGDKGLFIDKKNKKILGLIAFIGTGIGLIISSIKSTDNTLLMMILGIIAIFYFVGLKEYYKELMEHREGKKLHKSYSVLASSFFAVTITWYLNHTLNLGPVVANGIVGVLALLILPKSLAGMTFTSSFVGMSSLAVIPSLAAAGLGGIIVGLIILTTGEIYVGIGGKGGTTAAISTWITKFILGIFN